MKPRLFIGSSTESLDVANAIQSSLDYDATVTVWNQGIFNLSSDALSDLLNALNKFDFAIFVFQPNDVTVMRSNTLTTVRDNVIFEMGLFLGRLGKDKVFYLTDRSIKDLHLPTDLIGLTAGTYNSRRDDGNFQAALGPFCFEVRKRLKSFIYENLVGMEGEADGIKRLAVDKPEYWEYLLAAELLKSKLNDINVSYNELNDNLVVQRMHSINYKELKNFLLSSYSTLTSISEQFVKTLKELTTAFGPLGLSGSALEIKKAVDRMILICKELLAWEYELNSFSIPQGLEEIKVLMKGWSKTFIEPINSIAPQLIKMTIDDKAGVKPTPIHFDVDAPEGTQRVAELFAQYIIDNNITDAM